MKYTSLKGEKFDFNGLIYYDKSTMKKGSEIKGGCYKDCHTREHISINGEDYLEFTPGYYVKVDDMYNRDPYDKRITFSNEISYEIY